MEETQTEQAPRRVSVILVSCNNAAGLRRTLGALEALRERETMEIVVVDNGSTDACPRMDEEFPSITLLRLPRYFGRVKALNIGMRTAKGEFYFYLEPEMEVAPDAIGRLAAELDRNPEAAAACPLVATPEGATLTRLHPLPLPGELQRAWREGELEAWTVPAAGETPVEVDYFQPPVFLVRSYFLKGLRYIDERYGEAWWDLEIAAQILKASKKIVLVPEARVTAPPAAGGQGIPAAVRGLMAADRALSAALWSGKHYGGFQGAKFRAVATLRALGGALAVKDAGCRLATLRHLMTGQKLDGSL